MKKIIVVSASSEIGAALCKRWAKKNKIIGTFRTESKIVQDLKNEFLVHMLACDLLNVHSVHQACEEASRLAAEWDVLVFASGMMEPIGPFEEINFDEWEASLQTNMLRPLRMLHLLLPFRNPQGIPTVIFFAGAGSNNAALYYSAYAASKITLIKMCELLDAEIPNVKFAIIGPGWVKTKIHESTLAAKEKAGKNFQRTLDHYQTDQWVSMEKVVQCCDWVISAPHRVVSGRNFSVSFDSWGSKALELALGTDLDMYKLRRYQNSWKAGS